MVCQGKGTGGEGKGSQSSKVLKGLVKLELEENCEEVKGSSDTGDVGVRMASEFVEVENDRLSFNSCTVLSRTAVSSPALAPGDARRTFVRVLRLVFVFWTFVVRNKDFDPTLASVHIFMTTDNVALGKNGGYTCII